MAAMHLGDFGAEVIKVEHPAKPDPRAATGRARTASACGGRRSAATSGRSRWTCRSAGRRARCCAGCRRRRRADRELPARHAGALGARLRRRCSARNPRLVLARVTGVRPDRPVRRAGPGFGTLAEAMSGFAAMTGEPDGPPTLPPFGLADGDRVAGHGVRGACRAAVTATAPAAARWSTWPSSSRSWRCSAPQITAGTSSARCRPGTGNRSGNNAPRNTLPHAPTATGSRCRRRAQSHRRAGAAAGRAARADRRAVVRHRRRPGRARRRAGRGRRGLDRGADARRGGRGVRARPRPRSRRSTTRAASWPTRSSRRSAPS